MPFYYALLLYFMHRFCFVLLLLYCVGGCECVSVSVGGVGWGEETRIVCFVVDTSPLPPSPCPSSA